MAENSSTITAIVNTRNAEKHLRLVLEFLQGFDEILVCDMDSTDDTLEIARQAGCRIVTYHSETRNCCEAARDFALRQAKSEWVFFVDADEIVPARLQEYLKTFSKNPYDVCGLEVARKNFVFNRWNKVTYPDYQLRFLKKNKSYWPPEVHARPQVNGKIDRIPASRKNLALLHLPPSQSEVLERLNRYTNEEVLRHPEKMVTFPALLLKPFWRFLHSYIFKGGFLYGKQGFINSCNNAVYKFYTLDKIYESRLSKENGELEKQLEEAKR